MFILGIFLLIIMTFIPYLKSDIDLNEWVKSLIELHFDPKHGAPYWIKKSEKLSFDPKKDINSIEDLIHFPTADQEVLRKCPTEYFMPKRFPKSEFDIGESSGTTGPKKRIPWHKDVTSDVIQFYNFNLDLWKIPKKINYLALGPPGLYEKHIQNVVQQREGLCFFIGIEPKGMKEALAGVSALKPWKVSYLLKYLKPLNEEFNQIMKQQNIGAIISAPQMLKKYPKEIDVSNLEAVLWGGVGLTPEDYGDLKVMYDDTKVTGWYGNIFWGPAFNIPSHDDKLRYYPPFPYVSFEVVMPGTKKPVGYGARGQVMFSRIGKDFFWPNQLERDIATKIKGDDPYFWNGAQNVAPLMH